ncbi:MAG: alkaline phosphatase family protein [Planctomycetota bacterium]|nr:alkaline phosphatase family protein [Planctomycetota bacterium]
MAGAAHHATARVLLVFALTLLGLVGVGRLAIEAWLYVPAPGTLPEIGATTDRAEPFLMVIIDGLREDSAWTTDDPPMPWLQEFARRGAWGTSIAGEPTLTAPCVRALLTGRRPDLLTGFRNFNARPVQGSIIGYLHARGAHTAHGGDAAAFQFCRDHFEARDVLQFPDQGPTDQGQCDLKAVPHVLERIQAGADCVTLHLTKPDHAGHKYGALGREYWEACRTVDGQVREVVEAFLALHPKATVLVASDHGVSSMGTHGGGEASAKRAPFALVGPNVAQVHLPSSGASAALDQCAFAPSICALLGLPQPPLADAPPDPRLLALPESAIEAAISAYVEARLIVARDLHGDEVDVIEKARAERTIEQMAGEVNRFLKPNSTGHASLALIVAALWLIALVALVSRPGGLVAPGGGSAAKAAVTFAALTMGFFLAMNQLEPLVTVPAPVAGALVVLGAWLTARAVGLDAWRGAAFTVACLASVPVLTGGGITLQETFTRASGSPGAAGRLGFVMLAVALVCLVFLRPRRILRALAGHVRTSPGLIAAFGGVIVGFTLTLRPFIDPHVRIRHLYAVAGVGVVAWMLLSPGVRARPLWERLALGVVGLVLFVATRLAEGNDLEPWVNLTPIRDNLWFLLGVALVVALVAIVPRPRREDRLGLTLAGLALGGAFFLRLNAAADWLPTVPGGGFLDPSTLLVMTVNLLGLAALAVTVLRGSADGRLLVRLLAGVALARRLSVMDAEFAVFALTAVGAALAARARVPSGRVALAWLAVGLLALRTAVFHAMGFEESFSTLDVGQAFAGLGGGNAQALDAAGGAVITWQVIAAGIQLALRMALPWVLILAALSRAVERTHGHDSGVLRCVLGDLAVSFAARGAAIATALWAWWRNAWWMTHAYTVYAYAAADVVLLLLCASLCGAWTPAPGARREAKTRAEPVPTVG